MAKIADVASGSSVPPTKENTCAVIVSYFPDSDFPTRVARVSPQVGRVVVVDNGSDSSVLNSVSQALRQDGTAEIIRNARNLGIAKALNQGVAWAQANGFSWVLLLDQDTIACPRMLATLIRVYEEFADKSRLAVVGCSYSPRPDESRGAPPEPWTIRKVVITSGSLLRLDVLQQIGPFREQFFIDFVDYEFCLRARKAGFTIVEVQERLMRHFIGSPLKLPVPWLARATSNHRPWRFYYITRNLLVLTREYITREPTWIIGEIYIWIKRIILVLLFEKSRMQKMKYATLGLYDGLLGHLDRIIV